MTRIAGVMDSLVEPEESKEVQKIKKRNHPKRRRLARN